MSRPHVACHLVIFISAFSTWRSQAWKDYAAFWVVYLSVDITDNNLQSPQRRHITQRIRQRNGYHLKQWSIVSYLKIAYFAFTLPIPHCRRGKKQSESFKEWNNWVVCEMKKTKCPCKIKISVLFVSLWCANLCICVKSREESKFTY